MICDQRLMDEKEREKRKKERDREKRGKEKSNLQTSQRSRVSGRKKDQIDLKMSKFNDGEIFTNFDAWKASLSLLLFHSFQRCLRKHVFKKWSTSISYKIFILLNAIATLLSLI